MASQLVEGATHGALWLEIGRGWSNYGPYQRVNLNILTQVFLWSSNLL